MNKESLYIAFLNALFGVVLSLLLKGNLLIYGLTFIIFVTILFIERRWVYEKIFKRKTWRAVAGYAILAMLMIGFASLVTRSNRDQTLIVKTAKNYLHDLKPAKYEQAYRWLSVQSKKTLPLDSFIKSHTRSAVDVHDFRIEQAELNEFDKTKAVVRVSSPFLIYGQNTTALELVKEEDEWRIVLSPQMIEAKNSQSTAISSGTSTRKSKKRSSDGSAGRFLRSLF
jgi:hypothetical protein